MAWSLQLEMVTVSRWELEKAETMLVIMQEDATENQIRRVQQAIDESGGKIPVVAHKKDREDWLLTLRAKDLKGFVESVSA